MKVADQICIIDDDAIAIFGLKRALKAVDNKAEPLIFENGLDAMENFGRCIKDGVPLPTTIFLDVNMPVMDGWDFMVEFTKLLGPGGERPEIFIMTSSIDAKDLQIARKYSLDANYLVKPVTADVLGRILV